MVEAFGFDRTLYVLANTVQHKEMDGRIDSRNKQWAKTVPIYEDGGAGNSSLDYCLHKAHPGLINIFSLVEIRKQAIHDVDFLI